MSAKVLTVLTVLCLPAVVPTCEYIYNSTYSAVHTTVSAAGLDCRSPGAGVEFWQILDKKDIRKKKLGVKELAVLF